MFKKDTKFATKAIHNGNYSDPVNGSIMPPIYMTSTFLQSSPGNPIGNYDYTRAGNPNFTILENSLASLENGSFATVFSSGLGALTAILSLFSSGDTVVLFDGMYGGTFRLLNKVFSKFNLQFISINPHDENALQNAFEKKPKALLFETPTNPLLTVYDIEKYVNFAKQHKALCIVDNTFATPYFQNPLDLKADIVWHSCTKYIGGHSDVIGGVAITNNEDIKKQLDFYRMAIGLNPSPFDTWLTTRGIKTLSLRMEQHQKNALDLIEFLQNKHIVKKIYYPSLNVNSPLTKQMRGYGGIVSVEFNLSLEQTKQLVSSFQLFALAESLGGVESLVCHPATMTHASIPPKERERMGLSEGLVRFSVGIEHISDLKKDIEHALSTLNFNN